MFKCLLDSKMLQTKSAEKYETHVVCTILLHYSHKGRFMGLFQHCGCFGQLYSYPQQVPAFISRGATHYTDARDLYQRRRELLPMNFASKSVIHENPLGSFTCRKAGTWDILFYFPSEGRHTEDFPDARKSQRLRPGLNQRTRIPESSMLTTTHISLTFFWRICTKQNFVFFCNPVSYGLILKMLVHPSSLMLVISQQ